MDTNQVQVAGAAMGKLAQDQVAPPPSPFMDTVLTQLDKLRENVSRASNNLSDLGFFADPSPALSVNTTDKVPDTKRASIIEQLREVNERAIALVQQTNKL